MGHKGHYGHYTGNARHSVNSWEEQDVKKGIREEKAGHKGYADALFDDAHGSYNYDGHNSTGAERKGPAQWNYNQAPSAAYTQFDQIPQHLRFGQMDAAAMSNSEAGNDPFATTGRQGNAHWTDSSNSGIPNQGFMPTNEWGNYKPTDPLANVSLSPPQGGVNPNKAHFARHNKPTGGLG